MQTLSLIRGCCRSLKAQLGPCELDSPFLVQAQGLHSPGPPMSLKLTKLLKMTLTPPASSGASKLHSPRPGQRESQPCQPRRCPVRYSTCAGGCHSADQSMTAAYTATARGAATCSLPLPCMHWHACMHNAQTEPNMPRNPRQAGIEKRPPECMHHRSKKWSWPQGACYLLGCRCTACMHAQTTHAGPAPHAAFDAGGGASVVRSKTLRALAASGHPCSRYMHAANTPRTQQAAFSLCKAGECPFALGALGQHKERHAPPCLGSAQDRQVASAHAKCPCPACTCTCSCYKPAYLR